MDNVRIDSNVFIPMPVTLVGSLYQGRPNFMAAGWVSRVNANPPRIGVGIGRSHATADAIIENSSFSVCFPKPTELAKTDYCGIATGRRADKSSLFTLFYGDLKTAPMIDEASLNLECALVQTVEGPSNFFFIGDIKGAYASRECLENDRIDPLKAGYILLTMPDNTYWSLGENLGRAWSMGKQLMKK